VTVFGLYILLVAMCIIVFWGLEGVH